MLLATVLLLLASTVTLAFPADAQQRPFLSPSSPRRPPISLANSTRLPLTLGVMSLCPDARLCESVMDRVLEQVTDVAALSRGGGGGRGDKVTVGDLVDLRVEFIAARNKSAEFGTTCKHGDRECKGNVQQLCAIEHWGMGKDDADGGGGGGVAGERAWQGWWDFIQCLDYDPSSRVGSDSAASQCARLIGREWTKELQACVDGREGTRLARTSAKRLARKGVDKSCSILVRDEVVCIHDSTWKQCPSGHEVGDFKRLIEREWEADNGGGQAGGASEASG